MPRTIFSQFVYPPSIPPNTGAPHYAPILPGGDAAFAVEAIPSPNDIAEAAWVFGGSISPSVNLGWTPGNAGSISRNDGNDVIGEVYYRQHGIAEASGSPMTANARIEWGIGGSATKTRFGPLLTIGAGQAYEFNLIATFDEADVFRFNVIFVSGNSALDPVNQQSEVIINANVI